MPPRLEPLLDLRHLFFLAAACTALLSGCSRVLPLQSLELLLELLLVLAQDDWPQVGKTAQEWLQSVSVEQGIAIEQGMSSQVGYMALQ